MNVMQILKKGDETNWETNKQTKSNHHTSYLSYAQALWLSEDLHNPSELFFFFSVITISLIKAVPSLCRAYLWHNNPDMLETSVWKQFSLVAVASKKLIGKTSAHF